VAPPGKSPRVGELRWNRSWSRGSNRACPPLVLVCWDLEGRRLSHQQLRFFSPLCGGVLRFDVPAGVALILRVRNGMNTIVWEEFCLLKIDLDT
jgi:hypothetical protein